MLRGTEKKTQTLKWSGKKPFFARAARRKFLFDCIPFFLESFLLYPFLLRELFIVPFVCARSAKKIFICCTPFCLGSFLYHFLRAQREENFYLLYPFLLRKSLCTKNSVFQKRNLAFLIHLEVRGTMITTITVTTKMAMDT